MSPDFHPFVEREIVRTGEHRVRHPLLCCDHDWLSMLQPAEWHQSCSLCGAVCCRDERTGEITDYELPSAFDVPRPEQAPRVSFEQAARERAAMKAAFEAAPVRPAPAGARKAG